MDWHPLYQLVRDVLASKLRTTGQRRERRAHEGLELARLHPTGLIDYADRYGLPFAVGVASFELGADVLSQFTTEWDLAHGVVRLLRPLDCEVEQLAYWAPSYFRIDLEPQSRVDPSVEFEVHINGKSTKAVIDSGDATSHIRPKAAREVGVDPSGPDAEPAGDITGLAPQPIPTWIGRFNTFEVGGETIKNAHLLIGELSLPAETEYSGTPIPMRVRAPVVHLGADFLRANHLIIVPEKHVALFTYNGGAVFQTDHPE
jgi:hypothetical protein